MSLQLLCTNYGNLEDAKKVMNYCQGIQSFDSAVIISPELGATSKNQNECLVKEVPGYVVCDHVLSVHWDGYIINPHLWTDEFLEYDWIGAPWPLTNLPNPKWRVGSGGFFIFSRRFADIWAWLCDPDQPFDWQVGALLRDKFEAAGMKYAPFELACKFAKECNLEDVDIPEGSTYGFHGFGYNPEARKAYRKLVYHI